MSQPVEPSVGAPSASPVATVLPNDSITAMKAPVAIPVGNGVKPVAQTPSAIPFGSIEPKIDSERVKSQSSDTKTVGVLIPCTDCGKEISRNAGVCPHCGSPTAFGKQQAANRQAGGLGLGGLAGLVFFIYLAWKYNIFGLGGLPVPVPKLPPIEVDSSVNSFFEFSDWKRDKVAITCHIKAKTRIDPGLGNLTPVAELYDKNGVRLEEDSFSVPSTMTEGEVVEKSIIVFDEKLDRTVRIKIKVKRKVY